MSGKIVTITNPVELLLAQLQEIRDGNTATRAEIERLTRLLRGGEREEARLERDLAKALDKHRETAEALQKRKRENATFSD